MMHMTETANDLVISYPGWLSLLLFTLSLMLAAWIARHFAREARFLGYAMAALLLFAGGTYFFTFSARLTPEGGQAYAMFRGGHSQVDWRDARGVVLETRSSRGNPVYIVVHTSTGRPFEFNASALSDEQRGKALNYIRTRIPRAATPQR